MSVDLLGERQALEMTRTILKGVDRKGLSLSQYKKLARTIYDQQLQHYTKLNRSQRHKKLKELFDKKPKNAQKANKTTPLPRLRRQRKQRSEQKQGENSGREGDS